jgi:hypothetical protein
MSDLAPAAAPRKEWTSDLWRLGVILALALATRAWVLTHTEVTSRDSIGFIRYALALEEPSYETAAVLKFEPQPPGYAFALLAVSRPVRAVMGGTTADAMVRSAQLTSVLASLLLVVPMYFLGKLLFDRQTAFVATLLFQVLPVCTAVTSDGLSDGLFLLMMVTSVWFAALGLRRGCAGWFAAAGAAGGLAYLVRPEGLVVVLGAGLVMAGLKCRGVWAWRPGLLRAGALMAGLVAVGSPYALTIGKLTNKPTGINLLGFLSGGKLEPTWTEDIESTAAPAAVNVPLAAWWRPEYGNRKVWAIKAIGSETAKTSFYVLPLFAAMGISLLRRQIRDDAATALLLVVAACHLLLLWAIAGGAGYVAERHTLLLVFVGCYFAAVSFPEVGRFLARTPLGKLRGEACWTAALAAAIVIACLAAGLKPLHANRAGHKQTGRWLAARIGPHDHILDPFAWAEFYAGRVQKPDLSQHLVYNVYVITEDPKAAPHPRLHQMRAAKELIDQSECVYSWPENSAKPKVFVYKFVTSVPHNEP